MIQELEKPNRLILKEELENLHLFQKLKTFEIADIYDVSTQTIVEYLDKYEISKMQKFYQTKENFVLNEKQKEFLIGCLMGDGSVVLRQHKSSYSVFFKVSHCKAQKEYLLWKESILTDMVGSFSTKLKDKRGNSIMYSFSTLTHEEFKFFRNLFHDGIGKKIIKPELENYLTPFSVAVWYMDDGGKSNTNSRFATHGFSNAECQMLADMLKNKFNIVASVCIENKKDKGKKYTYLHIDQENTIILHNLIKNYIVDCMKYKII